MARGSLMTVSFLFSLSLSLPLLSLLRTTGNWYGRGWKTTCETIYSSQKGGDFFFKLSIALFRIFLKSFFILYSRFSNNTEIYDKRYYGLVIFEIVLDKRKQKILRTKFLQKSLKNMKLTPDRIIKSFK